MLIKHFKPGVPVLLFCSLLIISFAAYSSAQEQPPAADQVEPSKTYIPWPIPEDAQENKQPQQTENLMQKFIISISLVVIMGGAAFYLSRKLGPKLTTTRGKNISVIETISLGQQKAIHLVQIGSRKILIGATNTNINTLADITPAESSVTNLKSELN